MSARERTFKNLASSTGSQFPSTTSSSPSLGRRTEITQKNLEAAPVEARRRCERNYSDIFFDASAVSPRTTTTLTSVREKKEISRGEPTGSSNCNFLDHHIEVTHRSRASPRGGGEITRRESSPIIDDHQQSPRLQTQHSSWPWKTSSGTLSPRSGTSPSERLVQQERACWDTTTIMDATSELSRRRRREKSPESSATGGFTDYHNKKNAAERKRHEMTSGQVRMGTGNSAAPWDDGRSAGSPPSPKPSMHSRSCTNVPTVSCHIKPNSARSRKVESLMSNQVF